MTTREDLTLLTGPHRDALISELCCRVGVPVKDVSAVIGIRKTNVYRAILWEGWQIVRQGRFDRVMG